MRSIIWSILIIVLFFISGTLVSQDAVQVLDQVYGLDQTLCNGKKYCYFSPAGTKGNQFLISPVYVNGSVTIKGKCYQGITLNYDIYNQMLLLKYRDEEGSMNILEVSQAWLTSFSLGTKNFEFLKLEQEPHFYQVLGEGPVRILYYWRKNLKLDGAVGSAGFVFSKAERDSFILMDGRLRRFTSKRSLVGLFDAASRPAIKTFLRKNKIKVRKASDPVMAELITFIGNIK
jgi:hypothetical protein